MVFTSALLSSGLGAASGFLFRLIANAQESRAKQFEMLIKQQQQNDASADLAAKRTPDQQAGNWVRRTIILSIIFAIIIAPFMLVLLDKTLIVETISPIRNFFGLFSWGGNTTFYEINSYLLMPEFRNALLSIIMFYFGSSVAAKKN